MERGEGSNGSLSSRDSDGSSVTYYGTMRCTLSTHGLRDRSGSVSSSIGSLNTLSSALGFVLWARVCLASMPLHRPSGPGSLEAVHS